MTAQPAPAAPVLDLDGFSWRFATPADAPVMHALAGAGPARLLFNLPSSEEEFADAVRGTGLRLAMVCTRDARPFGVAALTARSNRDLNAMIACVFTEPDSAGLALAAFVRHVFWRQAIHRLYAQMPVVDGTEAYVRLLTSIGFQQEGTVRGHAMVAGVPHDIVVVGLLRPDFEAWCRAKEPRLLL